MRKYLMVFNLILITLIGLHLPVAISHEVTSEKIEVACTDWPYILIKNDHMSGASYEITKKVFERANLSFDYKIYPWARVYYYGLNKPNFAIGCLERVFWRENHFYWIGPVNPGVYVYFYKMARNPVKINTLFDLTKYRIGVQRGSFYEDFLKNNSFTEQNIVPVTNHFQTLLMLNANRVDFVLMDEATINNLAKEINIERHKFKKELLAYQAQTYLALSKKTPPDVYLLLKKAYQELVDEGEIQKIIEHYFEVK